MFQGFHVFCRGYLYPLDQFQGNRCNEAICSIVERMEGVYGGWKKRSVLYIESSVKYK